MYPHVRQLRTRWPEAQHPRESLSETRADHEPAASCCHERAPQPASPSRFKRSLLT